MSSPLPPSSPPPPSTPASEADPFGFDVLERKLKHNPPQNLNPKTPRAARLISGAESLSSIGSVPSTPSPTKGKAKQLVRDEEPIFSDISPPPKPIPKLKLKKRAMNPPQDPMGIAQTAVAHKRPQRKTATRAPTKGSENAALERKTLVTTKGKAVSAKRKRSDSVVDQGTGSGDESDQDTSPPKRRRSGRLGALKQAASDTKTVQTKGKGKPTKKTAAARKSKKPVSSLAEHLDLDEDERAKFEDERQARIDYFKKLESYKISKETVYVV